MAPTTSGSTSPITIGFIVNPIAGMGGRVGLKGTDGVVERARALGGCPVAPRRARETLQALRRLLDAMSGTPWPHWLAGGGELGADALRESGFCDPEVMHEGSAETTREDTVAAVRTFVGRGVDCVLFCGGDGTARDVCSVCGSNTPILGIPAGVKMFSGVFGVNPDAVARLVLGLLEGTVEFGAADVLDLDEERYRSGEWALRLIASARTPSAPSLIQHAKMLIVEQGEEEAKEAIAADLLELMEAEPESVFLLGPGSTVQAVGKRLQIEKTLLGIDAVLNGAVVGRDLDEQRILKLLAGNPARKLVLSPIGAQGFVLGRGNLPLSPLVVRQIGVENLIVIATAAKLARTPVLHFDTGESMLDRALVGSGYLPVITGYRRRRMIKVAA